MIRQQVTTQVEAARPSEKSITGALLACGAVAGPLFVAVGFMQIPLRTGFDWTRQPLSLLSLGDLGWIQVVNFVGCGLLFVAGAFGLRSSLRAQPAGTWGPILIAGIGIGMIMGGLFKADPGMGFPPGAPAGAPTTTSWHSAIHLMGFVVGSISLVVASFVFARRYWKLADRPWALYSIVTGVIVATAFPIVMSGLIHNLIPLWFSLLVGWTWASTAPARLLSKRSRN